MKITGLLMTLLITMGSSLLAQDEKLKNAVIDDATIFNEAYLNKDYDTYIKYIIPTVIEMGGGAEHIKELVSMEIEAMEDGNIKIISIIPEKVGQVHKSELTHHVILTQQIVMEIGENKFLKKGYYLGESNDNGINWTFLNLEAYDQETIKNFIPGLSEEIKIPPSEDPIVIKE